MHILVSNDDGPPSPQSSPYVHSLVRELQRAGHVVSVCLPHTQRSWIGKAHMIGQTVKPRYYRPPPASAPAAGSLVGRDGPEHLGTVHARPYDGPGAQEEWVLVDGTPASCVQIGLFHCFQDRGPVDLVLCGPNYGRNTTAVFALSSGTLGGALEAAACRRRSIALSYAFFSRDHDPAVIAAASRHSVRVIEALARQWPADGSVDVYSVNVPLVEGVESHKTMWTGILQNYWGGVESCFEEVEGSVDGEAEEEERIRERGEAGGARAAEGESGSKGPRHMHFKWAPKFTDVYKSVEDAPPGNDGWAVKEGYTSVTPLKANFLQAATHLHQQELTLEPGEPVRWKSDLPTRPKTVEAPGSEDHFYAVVAYEDEYVQPLILSALESAFPRDRYTLLAPPEDRPTAEIALASAVAGDTEAKIVQITPYEWIDFDYALAHPATALINSYAIRKALIRKHFLSATAEHWVAKHPGSALKRHVKLAEAFEIDYAEFLDDALVDAFDLRASLERNEIVDGEGADDVKDPKDREWWILKPGMSDRGQGIRLFSTMGELQDIFDGWEAERPDSDEEEEDEQEEEEEEGEAGAAAGHGDYITTSHLRHFVAQPYIHPPLLVPGDARKFHIRTYVLAVGSIKVYVYREMLALFAAKPYSAPWTGGGGAVDLDAHLTNTCLQDPLASAEGSTVRPFWDLPLAEGLQESVFQHICAATGEVFEAAARVAMVHFQPLPNAFEAYGLDFMVDADGCPWLLEVNAFPDFRQTGAGLSGIVAGFWRGAVRRGVGPFVGGGMLEMEGEDDGMVLVRDVDLGRRITSATA